MELDISSYVPALGWVATTRLAFGVVSALLGVVAALLLRVPRVQEHRVVFASILSFMAPLFLFAALNVLPRSQTLNARWVTAVPSAFLPPLLTPLAVALASRLKTGPPSRPIRVSRRLSFFLGYFLALPASILVPLPIVGPFVLIVAAAPGFLLLGPIFPSGHSHYAPSAPHYAPLFVLFLSSAWLWSQLTVDLLTLRQRRGPA